jgi:hypothetical protein
MGTMNTNQVGTVATIEAVAGTSETIIAGDSDTIVWSEGQPTINFNNASQGKLADGTFDDATVAGGQHTITFPDKMMNLLHSGGAGTTEPKSWKYPKMCGAKVDSTVAQLGLLIDGSPSCFTGTVESKNLSCNGDGVLYKGRGCRGNMTISWDGANAPLVMTATGLAGALVSKTDITGDVPYSVIGNDTSAFETAGRYVFTIGGTVYQASTGEFDFGNGVTYDPANNESGVAQAKITGRDKRLKLTLTQLTAGDTIYDLAKDNTVFDVVGTGGVGAGYDMTFTNCQLLDPSNGDVDGTTSWDVELIVESALFLQKDLS